MKSFLKKWILKENSCVWKFLWFYAYIFLCANTSLNKNNKNCFLHTLFSKFIIFRSNADGSSHLLCIPFSDKNPIERIGSNKIKKVECIGEGKVRVVSSRPVGRFPHHRILHCLPAILPSSWISPPSAIVHSSTLSPLCWFLCRASLSSLSHFCQRQDTKHKTFNGIR